MEYDDLVHTLGKAIEVARRQYPSYPPGRGATWDQMNVDPEEAKLFAHAALQAVFAAGYDVVKR
jgi:hypothetical protein